MSLHHGRVQMAVAVRSFLHCERGQALPEYAMVTAMFGVAAIVGLFTVMLTSSTQLSSTQSRVTNAAISVPTP